MSIWFMHDNHTFKRMDNLSEDAAMDYCERLIEKEGCGMLGCKGEHGNATLHMRRGEPWRERARAFLRTTAVTADEVRK